MSLYLSIFAISYSSFILFHLSEWFIDWILNPTTQQCSSKFLFCFNFLFHLYCCFILHWMLCTKVWELIGCITVVCHYSLLTVQTTGNPIFNGVSVFSSFDAKMCSCTRLYSASLDHYSPFLFLTNACLFEIF